MSQQSKVSASSVHDQVLETEPWNEERHASGRGAVWCDCGQRVPGLLKTNDPKKASRLVQKRIFRMARQLNDPVEGYLWKSHPDVKQRVEAVAAKLACDWRFARNQQGPADPKNSTTATVEAVQASPAQPATVQQRQLQGHEKPEVSFALQVALDSYVAAAVSAST